MASNLLSVALAALMIPALAMADLYERQPESWVWYKDAQPAPEEQPKEAPKPTATGVASAADGKSGKETLRLLGEQMEEAEAQSVLNPTAENIKRSIELRKQVLALTQTYADRYEQVVWKNPELDYTLERPMRTDGLFTANPIRREKLMAALDGAATSNAIVYVFRSDCPYCKKFSPLLKAFAEAHGFTVLPFSLDGIGIEQFPFPKRDLDMLRAKKMLPKVVPAIYVVNPKTGNMDTVGFGLMNIVDLENRVALASGIDVYEGITTPSKLQE